MSTDLVFALPIINSPICRYTYNLFYGFSENRHTKITRPFKPFAGWETNTAEIKNMQI